MGTTAEKILALARGEIGVREYPPNSNNVKYNTAYYAREVSGSDYPWCAVFIWWLFREAGAPELYYGGKHTAYCPALMDYHRGQAVKDYRPGDIIFFNFSGKASAAHVRICESWDGTYITTIDGNTGTGSEANGGAVMRRGRHKQYIVGAYRLAYEKEEGVDMTLPILKKGSTGATVKALQALLTGYGYGLDVDGSFGPATDAAFRKWQKANGLEADGSCGPLSWGKLLGSSK